ncbi:hypothetical protein ALP22_03825 [Pseudomonas coronafaciens pv. porri]|nr:Unknown protein sequence [Pseudomonas coronafaciens pv. porri]RMU83125.1 hypothetical protein ALP22_03825 [Pseudomonas coronafaciens pv. porri]RMV98222.1 hypothetical protein ALP00_03288 [Pseudomonas coronafaciens pv. porri]RMW01912.1 hypothetical protein ALO99_04132 [Pseudomonas coronafaciens pv. porri]
MTNNPADAGFFYFWSSPGQPFVEVDTSERSATRHEITLAQIVARMNESVSRPSLAFIQER